MNTPRQTRRRSIFRSVTLTRCEAFFVNAASDGVAGCCRLATARQTFTPLTGGEPLVTFRCGTHRIKAGAPDLLDTQVRPEGFTSALPTITPGPGFVCESCGVTAVGDKPPVGWERYRAADADSPWWCATCIDALLTSLLEALREHEGPLSWKP